MGSFLRLENELKTVVELWDTSEQEYYYDPGEDGDSSDTTSQFSTSTSATSASTFAMGEAKKPVDDADMYGVEYSALRESGEEADTEEDGGKRDGMTLISYGSYNDDMPNRI